MGMRIPPFAFTEHGILMLASVLNIKHLESKLGEHDEKILLIFEYLRQFEQSRQQQEEQSQRKRIGFRPDN